jgi:hypothetical protein
MSKITNTSKLPPELHLLEALVAQECGRPLGSSIEDQEARGQDELVRQTSQLPTEGSANPAWEKMGVVFGGCVSGDELWRRVTLPEGWSLKKTEHSMWSHLVDVRGCVRGKVFYKAASYDRRATIYLVPRYQVDVEYERPLSHEGSSRSVVRDNATGEAVFKADWAPEYYKRLGPLSDDELRALYERKERGRQSCFEFLNGSYPEFSDPAAYWERSK